MAKAKKEKKTEAESGFELYSNYAKTIKPLQYISTGNHAIDRCLGGGIPRGRMVEIYGPYSGGKTLLCLEILAQANSMGGWAGLQDIERTYAPDFGERIGIDPTRFVYGRPQTIEQAFFDMYDFIPKFRSQHRREMPLALGMDSLAAAPTKHELEELEKADMTKAKNIGAWLRRVTSVAADHDAAILIVNQVRHKVGVMFGPTETTPGGDAPGFHASQRIRVEHGSMYKEHEKTFYEDGKAIGVRIRVFVAKNKVGIPFRRCEVITNFYDGIHPWSGLADLLADEGKLERDGTKHFRYNGGARFDWYEIEKVVTDHPEILA